MNINITRFFNEACPRDYSASAAEIGNDAGKITWEAAKEDAGFFKFMDTDDKIDAMRQFALESGGWNDEEVAAWSNREVNALFLQWISGDLREFFELANGDWQEWQELSEAGRCSSNLFQGDDEEVYYYVGS